MSMRGPLNVLNIAALNEDSVLSLNLGDFAFSKKLSQSTNWLPGKRQAKWGLIGNVNGKDKAVITVRAVGSASSVTITAKCSVAAIRGVMAAQQLGWKGRVGESGQVQLTFGGATGVINNFPVAG